MRNLKNLVLAYEGAKNGDRYHGFGMMHFKSNQRFTCFFKDGVPHGKGTFYPLNGSKIMGSWNMGIFEYEYDNKDDMDIQIVAKDNLDAYKGSQTDRYISGASLLSN